jgi:hypothetical protein
MTTSTKEVEVDVDLDDFDDYELLQELDTRGIIANQNYRDQITKIWELRRSGQSYQQALDELIYDTIGRLV